MPITGRFTIRPFSGWLDPADQLEEHWHKLSNPSFYDRPSTDFIWDLQEIVLTPQVLDPLLRILNYNWQCRATTNTTTTQGRTPSSRSSSPTAETTKWGCVAFENCRLAIQDEAHPGMNNQQECTSEQVSSLATALATRTLALEVESSPTILEILLDFPQLENHKFSIGQEEPISHVLCTKLCHMIPRTSSLTTISFGLPWDNDDMVTTELMETLRNATHLRQLCFHYVSTGTNHPPSQAWFGGALCDRLIRNHHPLSQLRRLDLSLLQLDDTRFIMLAQALPGSQIEHLNVRNNQIKSPGILELARQLPMIQCLKEIWLNCNPWEMTRCHLQKSVAALERGMATNYSLQKLWIGSSLDPSGKMYRLVWHYTTLNYAGRKLFYDSNNNNNDHNNPPNVPLGLWPRILERAGTSLPCLRVLDIDEDCRERWANALYFFLQNSISVIMSRNFLQNSTHSASK